MVSLWFHHLQQPRFLTMAWYRSQKISEAFAYSSSCPRAHMSLRWCHSAPTRAEGCQAASGVWMEATMQIFHMLPPADMLPYCIRSDEYDVYDSACFRRYWMAVAVQLLGPAGAYSKPPPDRCLSHEF